MNVKLLSLAVLLALVPLARSAPQGNLDDEYDYSNDEDDGSREESQDFNVPEFITTSQTVKVAEGQRLKLKCQVNKLSENFVLIWSRGDNDMLKVGPTRLNHDTRMNFRTLDNNEGETIAIDMAEPTDAGKYECRIGSQPPKSIWFDVQVVDPSELTNEVDAEAEAEAETAASDGDDGNAAGRSSVSGFGVFVALCATLLANRLN